MLIFVGCILLFIGTVLATVGFESEKRKTNISPTMMGVVSAVLGMFGLNMIFSGLV